MARYILKNTSKVVQLVPSPNGGGIQVPVGYCVEGTFFQSLERYKILTRVPENEVKEAAIVARYGGDIKEPLKVKFVPPVTAPPPPVVPVEPPAAVTSVEVPNKVVPVVVEERVIEVPKPEPKKDTTLPLGGSFEETVKALVADFNDTHSVPVHRHTSELISMSISELKVFAEKNNIDVSGIKKRSALIKVINQHLKENR